MKLDQEVIKKLRQIAISTANNAYSPYSKVKVGAAVLTPSGEIFGGCNIENSSFGGTVCAERTAIFSAVSKGHKEIKAVYVYTDAGWPPCGMCRQVMSEFATPDMPVIIGDINNKEEIKRFDEIFPLAFTPEHLK